VQATENLSDQFSTFQSNFAVLQASGLIGQQVTVDNTASGSNGQPTELSGTVGGISVVNGLPSFDLLNASGQPITDSNGNTLTFATAQILGIGSGTVAGTSTSTTASAARK
jgi:flagellar hook assembly protein FlgD